MIIIARNVIFTQNLFFDKRSRFQVRPDIFEDEMTHTIDCSNITEPYHPDIPMNVIEVCRNASTQFINFTSVNPRPIVTETWLRQHPVYYQVYCIGLNFLFATALPFGALLYLNISTVMALQKLGKQVIVRFDYYTVGFGTFRG